MSTDITTSMGQSLVQQADFRVGRAEVVVHRFSRGDSMANVYVGKRNVRRYMNYPRISKTDPSYAPDPMLAAMEYAAGRSS